MAGSLAVDNWIHSSYLSGHEQYSQTEHTQNKYPTTPQGCLAPAKLEDGTSELWQDQENRYLCQLFARKAEIPVIMDMPLYIAISVSKIWETLIGVN